MFAVALTLIVAAVAYTIAYERIKNSIAPSPLPTKEYLKLDGPLRKLPLDLQAQNAECDRCVFQKLGLGKSGVANFLPGKSAAHG